MKDIQDFLNVCIGSVQTVDTKKIIVSVDKEETLNKLKINDLIVFSGINADQKLVGLVTKISKKRIDIDEDDEEYIETGYSYNFCNSVMK